MARKKILIIDDEELIIKSLSKLLEKIGYEVFIAKNGQDAIIMNEEEEFDLIIADIRVPGINGVEAVRRIYSANDKNSKGRIPAIFITGYADENAENEAKKLNPAAYIAKPFDIPELVDKIKGILI
ncbi:MAG: response regulator [Candidatus Omnitrophica bacterium CG11_big_fil_rev_8_21_14_0_20_42_13]|uniref:Response regulator n=1 Tax=Candidatus Ghiorseimicrobium undicola TaxID=1974746 RepID=A0A2H0M2D4_9BACT|nr:MAG: response regulator [Candidatus Omnitrophica bacterium CG11_big_fil_rev_8_21_14_0_20_42_13]